MNILGFSGLDRSAKFKKNYFPDLSSREYRFAQGFDAAAALLVNGSITAAAAEERFSREKGTGIFPSKAIRYCLHNSNLSLDKIDYIAHGFSYEPFKSFYDKNDFTLRQYEAVYSPSVQIECFEEAFPEADISKKFVPVPHHLAHAASTFFMSGFNDALILVSDGMGEIHSMTVLNGSGNNLEVLDQVPALHSLGIFYGVFTLYLGFYMALDEYKIMGLAPYGNQKRFFRQMMEMVHLKNNGTYTIPLLAENKTTLEKETHRGILSVLSETFGPPREPGSEITQKHKDIAAALQAVLQTCQLHVLRYFKKQTGQKNLCLAGGVALNCSANGIIRRSRMFKKMFVQPAAGDDGSSLGAALYVHHTNAPKNNKHAMSLPLWGPEFDDTAIQKAIEDNPACLSSYVSSFEKISRDAAQLIADGKIVAWFQGRMEFGPRALGSRSILADPRHPEMRDRINSLVKKREAFRPFAPAITVEGASKYFDIVEGDERDYAHMLYVTQVRQEYRETFPAITHVDGSARVQTVDRNDNFKFWTLLNQLGQLTGVPCVLNTSFNVRGQPIVCTPREAIETFLFANLDVLVMGNYFVTAKE